MHQGKRPADQAKALLPSDSNIDSELIKLVRAMSWLSGHSMARAQSNQLHPSERTTKEKVFRLDDFDAFRIRLVPSLANDNALLVRVSD